VLQSKSVKTCSTSPGYRAAASAAWRPAPPGSGWPLTRLRAGIGLPVAAVSVSGWVGPQGAQLPLGTVQYCGRAPRCMRRPPGGPQSGSLRQPQGGHSTCVTAPSISPRCTCSVGGGAVTHKKSAAAKNLQHPNPCNRNAESKGTSQYIYIYILGIRRIEYIFWVSDAYNFFFWVSGA
jgi:hypothetical protein